MAHICIYVPPGLHKLVEESRLKLGLNRSTFYKTAILQYLQELGVLSTAMNAKAQEAKQEGEKP